MAWMPAVTKRRFLNPNNQQHTTSITVILPTAALSAGRIYK